MDSKQPAAYYVLIGVSLLLSILAVVTLLPWPRASKPNILGYRSVCPFAPSATAVCGLLAGVTCTLRNRLVSARKAAARYRPPFVPVGVGILLVALALPTAVIFSRAQDRYRAVIEETAGEGGGFAGLSEGTATATIEEGRVSATLRVTYRGDRITDLVLLKGKDVDSAVADQLFERVMGVQSTEVDAVSGATATSRVLLRAIEAATAKLR